MIVGLKATFDSASCQVNDELHAAIVRENPKDFDYVPDRDGQYVVRLLERTKDHPDAIPPIWSISLNKLQSSTVRTDE